MSATSFAVSWMFYCAIRRSNRERMKRDYQLEERKTLEPLRRLADQAFSRAAGAPLIDGNKVRLLINAAENYPAWLAAIGSARHHIHFESYIIHEDNAGVEFANSLIAKAQEGVCVRVIYDWMGGLGRTSRKFWNRLRGAGVAVRW